MAASLLVIAAVFVTAVIAFALAIAAENRHGPAMVVSVAGERAYCRYDADGATGLGVAAMVLLAAGVAAVMVATKCFCCGSPLRPGRFRAFAGISFVACWVSFVIAEACLLAASAKNAYHTRLTQAAVPTCGALRRGTFAAAAAFVFFTGVLAELHYFFHLKARDGAGPAAFPQPRARDGGASVGMAAL